MSKPAVAPALTYDQEVLADSPLGYWLLDETSGTTVVDSSGNSRPLTKGANATVNATAVHPQGLRSYDFPGSGANNALFQNDAAWQSPHAGAAGLMTLEGWYEVDSLAAINTLWGKNASGQAEWLLNVLTTGAVQFALFTLAAETVALAQSAAGVIVTGTPYHLVAPYDKAGDFAKVYVNGVEVATTTTSGNTANGTAPLYFGMRSSAGDRHFNGRASHLALYASALSAGRVAAHYAAA